MFAFRPGVDYGRFPLSKPVKDIAGRREQFPLGIGFEVSTPRDFCVLGCVKASLGPCLEPPI